MSSMHQPMLEAIHPTEAVRTQVTPPSIPCMCPSDDRVVAMEYAAPTGVKHGRCACGGVFTTGGVAIAAR